MSAGKGPQSIRNLVGSPCQVTETVYVSVSESGTDRMVRIKAWGTRKGQVIRASRGTYKRAVAMLQMDVLVDNRRLSRNCHLIPSPTITMLFHGGKSFID